MLPLRSINQIMIHRLCRILLLSQFQKLEVLSLRLSARGRSRRDKVADSNGGGGRENNPGNFANDREKASEAGRKGGQESGGNFKNDPERAAEAGSKGGQASHSGGR